MLKNKYISVLEKDYLLSEAYKKLTRPEKNTIIKKRARHQLAQKVSKPAKPWIWRVGYHNCTGQWSQFDDVPMISGSSLNRKPAKKRKATPPADPVMHKFSTRSRSKCRDKTTAFFRSVFKEQVFLTLTFIDDISDRQGVQILNKFLTVLRKDNSKIEYCWIAEHQKKTTGRIHFHLLLNQRLPIKRYNSLWTLQQYNAGLHGKTKEGRVVGPYEFQDIYDRGEVGKYFNPADIRKAHSINGLASYLTAYVTKQDKGEEFGCLAWHCSRKVSRLFTREVTGPSTFAYLLSFKNRRMDYSTGEIFEPVPFHGQFFSTVKIANKSAPLSKLKMVEKVNRWIMEGLHIGGRGEIPNLAMSKYNYLYE